MFFVGCNTGNFNDSDVRGQSRSDDCITGIVRRILNAQRQAVEDATVTCVTSCEQSIEDLLSPSRDRRPSRHTTIPFMLLCQDGCKTFMGSGFLGRDSRGGRREHFECIESPIFKVRGFVRGSDNCVRLELLEPVFRRGGDTGGEQQHHHHRSSCGSVCDFFGGRTITNFRETGVCITVDLRCFCGITCLDPITPVPL